ncbi:MAG: hypothetical protein EXR76_19320 [Myxococcales bacterium]|nr:hypothetical protein [Myxococcales bacterium]
MSSIRPAALIATRLAIPPSARCPTPEPPPSARCPTPEPPPSARCPTPEPPPSARCPTPEPPPCQARHERLRHRTAMRDAAL